MEKEVKHTPGPWVVANGHQVWHNGHNTVESPRICTLQNAGEPVAQLGRDEMTANARLIAASPDLLAACEAALALLDVNHAHWHLRPEGPVFTQLRSAIALAKEPTP